MRNLTSWIDRREEKEEEGNETYDESANEILDPVTAEIEVRIRVGELSERKGGLRALGAWVALSSLMRLWRRWTW
jgi:hypothetical protein